MEEKKNRHITLWVILILLLACVIGAVAYLYHDKTEQATQEDAEKYAWLQIQKWEGTMQLDSLEKAIARYQDTFIHGAHADMVEVIRKKIESERADWSKARVSDSVEDIEDFIRNHSDSYYRDEANRKVDSLSYVEANDEDTYAAYERYLDSFSDGMYAQQAEKRMEELDSGTTSEKETISAMQLLEKHFNALAANDQTILDETIAPMLTTYIGQNDASRADVAAYMRKMHNEDERSIKFTIQNTIVSKEVNEHKPTYSISFTLAEDVTKGSQTNTLNFLGLAKINDEMKITSLSLTLR